MKRILLLDGDIFAYRCASSGEQAIDWGEDNMTLHCDVEAAKVAMDKWIAELTKELEADEVVVALSAQNSDSYFRKAIYPPYKMNRKGRKPMGLGALKAHLLATYKSFQRDGLEGDDILGIMSTMPCPKGMERIIVSNDKDFLSIPGKLFNFAKPELGVITVTGEGADNAHMMQTLTGDATDGYPGCPGVGPKKAGAILFEAVKGIGTGTQVTRLHRQQQMWTAVVKAFKKIGQTEQDAIIQAQMAFILRASYYNRETREITLWHPPALSSASSEKSEPEKPKSLAT